MSYQIIPFVCSIPKSLIRVFVTFFSPGQVVRADIRWRYLCDLGRARVPRTTLKPLFAGCIWSSMTGPLPCHPFVSILTLNRENERESI